MRLWRAFASGYLRKKSRKKPPRRNRRALRPGRGLGLLVGRLGVGLEDPFHHLLVGGRGQIDPPRRRMAVHVFGEGHHPDLPVLDEGQESLEPAVLVNPLVRPRPEAELLPVVAEDGRPARVADRSEVAVDVLEGTERDVIAEGLVDRKDAEGPALVLGDVGRGQIADARVVKVLFVEERVLDPGRGQGAGQAGLPDALGQPERRAAAGRSSRPRKSLIMRTWPMRSSSGMTERMGS